MLGIGRLFQRGSGAAIGVAFGADAVAAVQLARGDRDRPPRLRACDGLPSAGPTAASALSNWVDKCGAGGGRAVGVLARGDYQVLSIEAPPVEPAELRRAVGWHVRDLIDFPLDEAVIDTFDPPDSAQRGRRMVYVVVARRATVTARAEQLTRAGLRVEAIDIPELAQREVSERLGLAGGHALLALDQNRGLLTVFRDGEHYLARTLDIGRAALAERGASASADLVLEVQRSFDYYESALSQPPLNSLLLFPPDHASDVLQESVIEQLRGVACRTISFEDIVAVKTEPTYAGASGLHALGAALRASGQALGAVA